MMPQFFGFDHVDTRVRSLTAVEAFYDKLMPEIGLPEKDYHIVDAAGNWRRVQPGEHYNTVEYHEKSENRQPAHFMGFIEDPAMQPVSTRIAFRIGSVGDLDRWVTLLGRIGARNIEPSSSYEDWAAVFFEDPAGTKLEIVARDE
ncbi:MAG: VOC family protein [Candidatus Eremiobacteraeota bacterium]|nr:VOC family protein [Candidatus Eremiobacteraeota bacterium]